MLELKTGISIRVASGSDNLRGSKNGLGAIREMEIRGIYINKGNRGRATMRRRRPPISQISLISLIVPYRYRRATHACSPPYRTMKQTILSFPTQFPVGLKAGKHIKFRHKFKNVVVFGMGGSAWPSDIMNCLLDLKNPIIVNRTYDLPKWVDKQTLCIFSSYSGNTEEPISAYKQAIKKKLSCVAITSGGELKKLCEKNKTQIALIPSGFQPRMATGYMFSVLYSILNQNPTLLKPASLKPEKFESKGKQIAAKLYGKIPIIYTPDEFKILGYVWKIKFNENTKIPAFANYFSELNHNEMNGWQYFNDFAKKMGKFSIIILRDKDDHPRMLKRMKLTEQIIKSKGIETQIIDITGKTKFEKIFNTILLGDWISYYLALKYKIDPLPVKLVEDLKAKMR